MPTDAPGAIGLKTTAIAVDATGQDDNFWAIGARHSSSDKRTSLPDMLKDRGESPPCASGSDLNHARQ